MRSLKVQKCSAIVSLSHLIVCDNLSERSAVVVVGKLAASISNSFGDERFYSS